MDTQILQKDKFQTLAIHLACGTKDRIVGITGQAGTGKTTIMKEVHESFTESGHNVVLAAPTGKAAKRISEATGIEAMTIHRLLEFTHPGDPDPKTGKTTRESVPRRTPDNPLAQSVILVDEYSMVNHSLNRHLIDAMNYGCLLRVFGDTNQLPPIEDYSVGYGVAPPMSPFKTHLKKFPSVTLQNIYRQGEGSDVVKNAHRILHRMCPQSSPDFLIKLTTQQPKALMPYVEADPEQFRSLDTQIITPTHRGWIGTRQLNLAIQAVIQSGKYSEGRLMPRNKWDKYELQLYVGDKILWTKNDYNLMIFNGETGIVTAFEEYGQVVIDFGDRTISVPPVIQYEDGVGRVHMYDPRVQLQLAYAITTHASQGSEYDSVFYLMDSYAFMLQDQANFYTGVTRARKKAHVISDVKSFQKAVVTQPRSL
jgi:exodeoxyribonuclease V alpha subunit